MDFDAVSRASTGTEAAVLDDGRHDYGETRFRGYGALDGRAVRRCVHGASERAGDLVRRIATEER